MNNRAQIYTYSIIYSASLDFAEKVPFVVAVLENQEDDRFMSYIEGYEKGQEIEIGTEVEFLKLNDDGNPIYRFL